ALLKVDEVYTFYEDSKGAIHIAHRKPSVYLFQDSIVRKKMYFDALVQGDGINSYVKIGNETFAIGNRIIINARLKQKDSTVYTILTPPPNPYLGVATSGNHLLFSLANGLILFKWENNKLTKINELIGDLTGSVFSDKLGRFWVCSQKYGAVCFDNKNKDFSNPRVYLDKKKITSMTQDQQGTYWFCTIGEGIYTLTVNHADSFNERDGLISKNITAINIDYNNRVWTGDDEGIVHMQKHNNLFTHWLIGPNDGYNRCRQIVPLADNTCWIVSDDYLKWGDGVTMHKSITHAAYKSALVKNNQIWYVSYSHLGYIDLNEKNFGNRIKEIRFTTIGLDINGYVWAGHMEGIYNLHDNFSYNWGNSFPLLKSRIIAIQAADSNHLWVATPTSGLLWVQIHDGTVQKVDIVNERIKKPIENIQSMYREDNGRLWLATNHGVYRLSPDWSVLHLDHTNGLAADDVNAVVVKGDTLWAGTVAGLSRLVLSTLGGDGEFATMISSLRFTLDNQVFTYHLLDSATTRRFTTLTADARIIELDLSALDFTCRGKINFEYIIRQELLPWYFMTPNNLFQWLLNGFSFPSDTTFLEKGTLNLGVQLEPGR
ncbi:MAG TPA: hypothetical protein PLT08_16700, partial [Anaerolineales bacterium]|nr:hypothetical protein [Anaerolineales bacterium]